MRKLVLNRYVVISEDKSFEIYSEVDPGYDVETHFQTGYNFNLALGLTSSLNCATAITTEFSTHKAADFTYHIDLQEVVSCLAKDPPLEWARGDLVLLILVPRRDHDEIFNSICTADINVLGDKNDQVTIAVPGDEDIPVPADLLDEAWSSLHKLGYVHPPETLRATKSPQDGEYYVEVRNQRFHITHMVRRNYPKMCGAYNNILLCDSGQYMYKYTG